MTLSSSGAGVSHCDNQTGSQVDACVADAYRLRLIESHDLIASWHYLGTSGSSTYVHIGWVLSFCFELTNQFAYFTLAKLNVTPAPLLLCIVMIGAALSLMLLTSFFYPPFVHVVICWGNTGKVNRNWRRLMCKSQTCNTVLRVSRRKCKLYVR